MTRYTLLLTDDEGEPIARVSYRVRGEDKDTLDTILVDEVIPAGYQLTDEDEMECRHHADWMDRETPEPEPRKPEFELRPMHPIRWGVKG